MKKYLVLLAVLAIFVACTTEKETVPAEVKAKFETDYPGITPEWEMEGDYFEAEYEVEGVEHEVVYDAEANLIETEAGIPLEELPAAIMSYLQENYAGLNILETEKGENVKEGIFYEVELVKGGKELELYFDEAGTFKEMVEEKLEEEDKEKAKKGFLIPEKPKYADIILGEWKLISVVKLESGENFELKECDLNTIWNFTEEAEEPLGDGTEVKKVIATAPDGCKFFGFESKWTTLDDKVFISSTNIGAIGGLSMAGLFTIVEMTPDKMILDILKHQYTFGR